MKLLEQTDEHVVVQLEYSERFYLKTSLSYATMPFINGISAEEKKEVFSGSRGAKILKALLDPEGKERAAKRKEARSQGKKWQRGLGWHEGSFTVAFTYKDLLSMERLLTLLTVNDLFDYHTDSHTVEEVRRVRESIVQLLDEVKKK